MEVIEVAGVSEAEDEVVIEAEEVVVGAEVVVVDSKVCSINLLH